MFLYGWPWKYTCDNIKLDIEEPRWESVKWTHLIQDWGALVSTVTNVRLTWTTRNVLTSSGLTELVPRASHVTGNIPRDLSDVTTMVSMITSHGHDGASFVSDVGTWVWMARTGTTVWMLQVGRTGWLATSVTKYQLTLRNIPEERRPQPWL
jgi:hypothetical protein